MQYPHRVHQESLRIRAVSKFKKHLNTKALIWVPFFTPIYFERIIMLDLNYVYKNYKTVAKNLKQRGFILNKNMVKLFLANKGILLEIEKINKTLNQGDGTPKLKKELKDLEAKYEINKFELTKYFDTVPNLLNETVPVGEGAQDNVLIKEVLLNREFAGNYLELAKKNGLNIEAGVALAGTRFTVMTGKVAKLHRTLIAKALDFYEGLGYIYNYVPNLVTQETMRGTGQFPKFKDDLFQTIDGHYLIPTGEVPLTNLVANKTLTEKEANKMLVTNTPCFRKEVGAYGKDTKGILRQHQFEKVELVRTCLPEKGLETFNEMVTHIDMFLASLDVQYRIIELCTKDIGFSGHKAYDFEIWFPSENAWREVATVTWCHDFQARRMGAKVKRVTGKKEYLHTLNGTGLAVGRVMTGLIDQKGEDAFK